MNEVSSKVEFGSEKVRAVWPEIYPIFEKHWEEIAHHKDIPLDPNIEIYHKLDDSGAIRVYTAREDGELVGYCVFFIHPNLHYKNSLHANQDVLYIKKEKRGRFGMKFISWCDEQLRKEGVQVISQHVKKAHDFGPLLKRLDYELVDLIYARRLF